MAPCRQGGQGACIIPSLPAPCITMPPFCPWTRGHCMTTSESRCELCHIACCYYMYVHVRICFFREYYFSDENLQKDFFLRRQVHVDTCTFCAYIHASLSSPLSPSLPLSFPLSLPLSLPPSGCISTDDSRGLRSHEYYQQIQSCAGSDTGRCGHKGGDGWEYCRRAGTRSEPNCVALHVYNALAFTWWESVYVPK